MHDFPHLRDQDSTKCGQNLSITLNGVAYCIDDEDELSNQYRSLHLNNNPQYSQFIRKSNEVEKSPSVFVVRVDKARMCDIMDQVKLWNNNSSKN